VRHHRCHVLRVLSGSRERDGGGRRERAGSNESATRKSDPIPAARAELTRLSSRVAGEVITDAVKDFQRVKAGDLLVQIDYAAQVAQAEASVAAAQAALDNKNVLRKCGVTVS